MILTQVEVAPTQPTNVIVALGNSITEGRLDLQRLPQLAGPAGRTAGRRAATGRWSTPASAATACCATAPAPTALARFDRDVLSVPGVKAVILLEGINDIGRGFTPTGATEPVTLEALRAAYEQIIARAHAHGIRVIGATLTPYQGATYASPAGRSRAPGTERLDQDQRRLRRGDRFLGRHRRPGRRP